MAKHQGQTTQIHQIKLPSTIQQVIWTKQMAAVGGLVGLEVFTQYVGNNSEMKIELSDKSGKTLGEYSDRIYNNQFWAEIRVPASAEDELYATVKLPKHGLQQKSPALRILPPIQISNAKWDKQEVRRGEILKLSAEVKGVPDGAEAMIEIWEHDADGAHDFVAKFSALVKNKKVEAEWKFEYNEDVDDIPTAEESEKGYHPPEYFFRVKIGEVCGESGLVEFKDWIEIKLLNEYGNPIADCKYTLQLADGSQRKGVLDKNGYARLEGVPPGRAKIEYHPIFSSQEGETLEVSEDEPLTRNEDIENN